MCVAAVVVGGALHARTHARHMPHAQIMQVTGRLPRDYAGRIKIETFRQMCLKWPVIAFAATKAQEEICRNVLGAQFWQEKQKKFKGARDAARDARAIAVATGGRVKDMATIALLRVEEAMKKSEYIEQAYVEHHAIIGLIGIVVVDVEALQLWQKSLRRPVRVPRARSRCSSRENLEVHDL